MWLKRTVMCIHENAMETVSLIQSKNIKTILKHIPCKKKNHRQRWKCRLLPAFTMHTWQCSFLKRNAGIHLRYLKWWVSSHDFLSWLHIWIVFMIYTRIDLDFSHYQHARLKHGLCIRWEICSSLHAYWEGLVCGSVSLNLSHSESLATIVSRQLKLLCSNWLRMSI